MTLRNKLIVGLAAEDAGSRVADVVQHCTGTDAALTISPGTLTVGAATVSVGATTGRVGFFGAAVTTRPSGVTLNNVTSIANALANLGLIATTTP
jgi:hypothetical protein